MKKVWVLFLVAAALSACHNNDGVPKVADPHNPLDADGKSVTKLEFIKKYCMGMQQQKNEDCFNVKQASRMDSTKGGLPKGW